MRIALTEKRDILGDMLAAKREGLGVPFNENGEEKKEQASRCGRVVAHRFSTLLSWRAEALRDGPDYSYFTTYVPYVISNYFT